MARGDGLHHIHTGGKIQIRLDIAGFQSRVSDLEQRVIAVEDHLNTIPEWDQELLCSKLIDLEDRGSRDNIRFFGFPEHIEGTDIQAFLKKTLLTLTGISFDIPTGVQKGTSSRAEKS
ncbi:hypothetical protein NDU88_005184 [Pleurodeles waltl]|uniref:Uncharacterized protein n=1 Tax=Pleurodeles waltl TaxID=8319 RepID=A0AAV7PLX2_PLEWA|nr:hypothetical protein NDU88_005184 [Pleurodeles waltl]